MKDSGMTSNTIDWFVKLKNLLSNALDNLLVFSNGSRVVVTKTDKTLTESAITTTELNCLNGVTSGIQGQLNDKLQWGTVPANAAATGTPGMVAYESGFVYVCIDVDTWQRAALVTW
jgi:hypothetical protein